MTRAAERLFALVRATLRNRMDDASLFEGTDAALFLDKLFVDVDAVSVP